MVILVAHGMNVNRVVKDELSGSIAKSFVAQISRFHRIQGSSMFHEAAEYVKSELVKMELRDAAVERFPADGKRRYWTHISPIGWSVRSAELHLIEPENKLLATYEDLPQSLHAFSNATRPEGVTARLVDVGQGIKSKDYLGKGVRGKFVLATGRANRVHEQAVYKRGALGVITDTLTPEIPNVRESLDVPDAHAYQAIWPTAEDLDKVTFGFSLSKRQGNYLRSFLREGKIPKLKAKVDSQFFPGSEDVVTATIKGVSKRHEEIFIIAHLCHPKPSANDNASGAGLLLEIARTIQTLITTGKIPSPVRTIRFLWVPETLGTVAYLSHHKDSASRFVAGINLDMVGQDQELCKSTLNVDRTPDSLPSYLNDFVFSMVEESVTEFDYPTVFGSASTFRYRTTAFSGGSDHAEFTEATTSVPCVMLLQWPDLYYHTSMDTIDNVSEESLKRVGWITAVAVLTLANATSETAYQLANQTATRGIERMTEASRNAIQEMFKETKEPKLENRQDRSPPRLARIASYYKDKIEHIVWREQEATKSVRRLGIGPGLNPLISKRCKDIADRGQTEIALINHTLTFLKKTTRVTLPPESIGTRRDQKAKRLVPRRLFKGTLNRDLLRKALSEKEYGWYEKMKEKDLNFDKKMAEIINFTDGKRDLSSIIKAVSAEYNEISIEDALKLLRDLKKMGLMTIQ